jgi:uncharacterized membrane protein
MDFSEKIEEIELSEILEEKILFPFIFAVYFVLSVYEHNIGQVYFTDTLLPLGIILVGTYLVYYKLNHLIDSRKRAGLITFGFMIIGFTYRIQIKFIQGRALILANLIFAAVTFLLIYKKDFSFRNLTWIANILTIFMLVIVLISISSSVMEGDSELVNSHNMEVSKSVNTPDIYYIIPDRYARNDILEEHYNFTNSEFTDSLQNKGFYISNRSYTNYAGSYLSLASSTNMQYLQDMGLDENGKQKDIYPILDNHRLQEVLKSQDYQYYHLGFTYLPTSYNPNSDINRNEYLEIAGFRIGAFERILISNTPFINLINNDRSAKVEDTRKTFQELEEISTKRKPKFVLAHLQMPHPPFAFNKNRKLLENPDQLTYEQKYLEQLQATNKFLNETLDEIIANEDRNTVIVVQSDEGPHVFTDRKVNWKEASDRQKRKRLGVINAIYAPGMNESKFYPRMTPVNTFRIIFNEYFGSNLSLQEDKVYLKERKKRHDLLEVEPNVLYPNTSLTTTQQYSEAVPRASTDATPQT